MPSQSQNLLHSKKIAMTFTGVTGEISIHKKELPNENSMKK